MSDPPGSGWLAPPPPTPPPPPPPPNVPEPAAETPLWGPRGGPVRDYRWIPAVGALILIVIVGLIVRSFLISYFSFRTPPAFPTPTPTPAGVEFQRAEIFWNNSTLPALANAIGTVPALNSRCQGTKLSATCHDAIAATDQKLQAAITVINQGDIPACLATDVKRVKGDLESMDGGLQIALRGYTAGDRPMVAQGLSQFHESLVPLSPDTAAVTKDVRVLCN